MDEIKINFLHICEYAFFSEDKKVNVLGVFDGMTAESFPIIHPRFSIVIGVNGTIFNKRKEIEILSPSGEPVISTQINVNLENKPKANLIINLIGVPFQVAGTYKIVFKIDDKIISPERQDVITINSNEQR